MLLQKTIKRYGKSISVLSLPSNSKIKVEVMCDVCSTLRVAAWCNIVNQNNHKCVSCIRRETYNANRAVIAAGASKSSSNRIGERHPRFNPLRPLFKRYKASVIKITEENYKNFKTVINPKNLPRKLAGSVDGHHLDHIIPVKYGFDLGIPPESIASVNNLQMLPWRDNILKSNHINNNKHKQEKIL